MTAIFHLFSVVWKTERIPAKWLESTIIQLSKDRFEGISHMEDANVVTKSDIFDI